MSGPRQPVNLVLARGSAHMTKAEIADRQSSEVQPVTDGIVAPSFLSAAQKKDFNRIADQLQTLKIMGETDCDTLARYIVSQEQYVKTLKEIREAEKEKRSIVKDKPKPEDYADDTEYREIMGLYYTTLGYADERLDRLDKRLDRYFKQATTAAGKMGLTISDRCRLVVPGKQDPPKTNKFSKFLKGAGDE